ncbi:MAG: zeta toxin family protein [Paludibacteraceae bacterium]|nr:zeta toxin family protein [Paludibacteraceae bacterium]MBR4840778.1 zeta toxin family protein [Paludibacteraceae bacterium]
MYEKKPVLIIVAGPNGSGKTTVTSKILRHQWLENSVYRLTLPASLTE